MASITYTGGGQAGNWTDPANWSGGVAPGTSDAAIVSGSAAQTVGSFSIGYVMLLGSETITFDGTATTPGGLIVSSGATAVFAAGASLVDGGILQVGVGGAGTLVADGAATVLTAKSFVLGKGAQSTGAATVDAASLTIATSTVVGSRQGAGTLTVSDDGQLTASGSFVIAQSAGSSGSVTLTSGGDVSVAGSAAVGLGGTGTLTVDSGSSFAVTGGLAVNSGSTVDLAGGTVSAARIAVGRGGVVSGTGTLTATSGIADNGSIVASGGTLTVNGKLAGSGTLSIGADSTAAINASTLGLRHITFSGTGGTLALTDGATVAGTVTGFAASDQITMAGVTAASLNSTTDVLTLSNAGTTVAKLHLSGAYASDVFTVSQSNGVGVITVNAS